MSDLVSESASERDSERLGEWSGVEWSGVGVEWSGVEWSRVSE